MKTRSKKEPNGLAATMETVERKYVSVAGAEQLTGVSRWTWRAMAYSGRIASSKVGRRLLIPLSEVERVVTEGMRPRIQRTYREPRSQND